MSHAMRRMQLHAGHTSRGDRRRIRRARIADIVNTPVKPRVMRVENETRFISREGLGGYLEFR
jgi:hypothetical protein